MDKDLYKQTLSQATSDLIRLAHLKGLDPLSLIAEVAAYAMRRDGMSLGEARGKLNKAWAATAGLSI